MLVNIIIHGAFAAADGRRLFATVAHHHIIVADIEELPERQLLVAAAVRFSVRKIYFRCAIVEHLWWRVIDIEEPSFAHNRQIHFFRMRLVLGGCCRRLTFLSVAVFRRGTCGHTYRTRFFVHIKQFGACARQRIPNAVRTESARIQIFRRYCADQLSTGRCFAHSKRVRFVFENRTIVVGIANRNRECGGRWQFLRCFRLFGNDLVWIVKIVIRMETRWKHPTIATYQHNEFALIWILIIQCSIRHTNTDLSGTGHMLWLDVEHTGNILETQIEDSILSHVWIAYTHLDGQRCSDRRVLRQRNEIVLVIEGRRRIIDIVNGNRCLSRCNR